MLVYGWGNLLSATATLLDHNANEIDFLPLPYHEYTVFVLKMNSILLM